MSTKTAAKASKGKGKARKASSKASTDNSRAAVASPAITAISIKAAKKCENRNWPFEKFKAAVVERAKRMGVKIKTGELQGVYDAKVTIPDAVRVVVAA